MCQYAMSFQFFGPQPCAKAAGIGITQHFAVTHHQIDMVMLFRRQLFSEDPQAAGHAKMNDDPAIGQLQKQIFRAALDAEDRFIA